MPVGGRSRTCLGRGDTDRIPCGFDAHRCSSIDCLTLHGWQSPAPQCYGMPPNLAQALLIQSNTFLQEFRHPSCRDVEAARAEPRSVCSPHKSTLWERATLGQMSLCDS